MTERQKKLVENYIRNEVKKRLNEVKYTNPGIGDGSATALQTYYQWFRQFSHIASLLTNATGYWYVGSSQKEIADKIKQLSPEQLKDFRTQMAKLLLKSREADKIMREVREYANDMIQALE